MKLFICAILVAQAVIYQANSQVIRTCGPNILAPSLIAGPQILAPTLLAPQLIKAPAPVIAQTVVQPNTVANSLADTLSLLTVSSLLAETLPVQVPVIPGCGCGCGYPILV